MMQTRAYRNSMPTRPTEVLSALSAALSAGALLFLIAFGPSGEQFRRIRGYALCILAGIAINAILCGALSGPIGRYEMRLVWVLPLVASALALAGQITLKSRRSGITNQPASTLSSR